MAMSFEALLSLYLESLRSRRRGESQLKTAAQGLSRFFAHLEKKGIRSVRQVREADVLAFVRSLARERSPRTGRRLAANTCSLYVSVVRRFFAFLEERRLVFQSPARDVPLPTRIRLPRAIGERDVARLLEAPSSSTPLGQRDRALLELLYGSGLRLKECVRLDLVDLDLKTGTLLVRNGKGKKDRYVPLTGGARTVLETYLQEARPLLAERWDDGSLFLSRRGRRLGDMSVRMIVKRAGAKMGLKVTTHVLRHSYATHLLKGGADVRHVQKLLGHKDISTTTLYTKVDTSSLGSMLRRCHPRER
jgi:site-specific recombinase XerD